MRLKIGDPVHSDIYEEKTLLVKKGTIVTKSMVEKLKSRDVDVVFDKEEKILEYSIATKNIKDEVIDNLFYDLLLRSIDERKIGTILNSEEMFLHVKQKFFELAKDKGLYWVFDKLNKKNDERIMCLMNVFVLCVVIGKESKTQDQYVHQLLEEVFLNEVGKTANHQLNNYFYEYFKVISYYFELIYKHSLKPTTATEYLLTRRKELDRSAIEFIMNTIKIYPKSSVVFLTNKQRVKIVNFIHPNLVELFDLHTKKFYSLPLDLSIKIDRFLTWEGKKNDRYDMYLSSVKEKKVKLIYETFLELTYGLTKEEVYERLVIAANIQLKKEGYKRKEFLQQLYLLWFEKTLKK